MQKYFIDSISLENNTITGDDVFHIKNVMRQKVGDKFIVSDSKDEFLASIVRIDKDIIYFEKLEAIDNLSQLPFYVDIFQGYPKGDKLDDICKHSTELGVNKVFAVNMKRSIVKIDPKKIDSKCIRFDKIMKEASEQSHRKTLAHFGGIIDLKKIDFSCYDYKILAFEESAKIGEKSNFKNIIQNAARGSSIAVLIGPEGGIDNSEVEYLNSLGFINCAFGPRILRTETASMYALSAISYESELK